MINLITLTSNFISKVVSVVSRVMLAFVAMILLLQLTLRYCFDFSLPWPEEAARYLMIWIVMLSSSQLVKYNDLISVDFFDHIWPKSFLVYRNAVFRFLLVILLVVMAVYGWDQAIFSLKRTTPALQISWFWPMAAVPVGAVLMAFQMIAMTVTELKNQVQNLNTDTQQSNGAP